MMKISIENKADEQMLQGILELENTSFQPDARYVDAEVYYRESLESQTCINVVARDFCDLIIGYMLIVPQPVEVRELLSDDPLLEEDPNCVYVDTMAVAPKIKNSLMGGKVFVKMLDVAVAESIARGYQRFCTHARTINGLNTAVKKYFGERMITSRKIEKWQWVSNEPYEYVEGWLRNPLNKTKP